MEVPLVLVNTVILFLLLPVIHGNGHNRVGDMAFDELSVTCRKHPRVEQFRERNDMQEQSDHNVYENEPTINSLMRNNKHIFKALEKLEEKIDHILNTGDLKDNDHQLRNVINKLDTILQHIKDSARNSVGANSSNKIGMSQVYVIKGLVSANKNLQGVANDFKEVMINSKTSMQSLQRIAEILQDIDVRIRTDPTSPPQFQYNVAKNNELSENEKNQPSQSYRISNGTPRRLEHSAQNYDDIEFTGYSRNTYPTETQTHFTDQYKNHHIASRTKDKTTTVNRVRLEPNKSNCDEILESGIYRFGSKDDKPNAGGRFYNERYCDYDGNGVGWTVIQRRFASNHQLNFNRTWLDYKLGFGKLNDEFWYGNDFIHKLTSERDLELKILFENKNGEMDWAVYSLFKVKSEENQYKLVIEGHRGSSYDKFQYLNGQAFSTFDRQHGKHEDASCASRIGNGWWFKNCTEHALGNYIGSTSTKMMVRPTRVA